MTNDWYQMPLLCPTLPMVKAVDPSTLTMWPALALRPMYYYVAMTQSRLTVATLRMLEFNVKLIVGLISITYLH